MIFSFVSAFEPVAGFTSPIDIIYVDSEDRWIFARFNGQPEPALKLVSTKKQGRTFIDMVAASKAGTIFIEHKHWKSLALLAQDSKPIADADASMRDTQASETIPTPLLT